MTNTRSKSFSCSARSAMSRQILRVELPDHVGVVRAGDQAGIPGDLRKQRVQRIAGELRAAREGLAAIQQLQAAIGKILRVDKKIVRLRAVGIVPEDGLDGKGDGAVLRQGRKGPAVGIRAVVIGRGLAGGLVGHGVHHDLHRLLRIDAGLAAFRMQRGGSSAS